MELEAYGALKLQDEVVPRQLHATSYAWFDFSMFTFTGIYHKIKLELNNKSLRARHNILLATCNESF